MTAHRSIGRSEGMTGVGLTGPGRIHPSPAIPLRGAQRRTRIEPPTTLDKRRSRPIRDIRRTVDASSMLGKADILHLVATCGRIRGGVRNEPVGEHGSVTAIDLSEHMLFEAKARDAK